jgi:hypothetical protein
VVQAEGAMETARLEVAAAGEKDACAAAEAAAGGAPVPANATRAALTLHEDRQHELAAASSAFAKLKTNLGDLEDSELEARNRVTAAVDIVLRASAAQQALSEAETAALRLRELMPTLCFFLWPEMDPAMVGRPMPPLFSTDWDTEARHLGRERADRRAFAATTAARTRDAGFSEISEAIKRFVDRPLPQGDAWYRHPAFEAWRAARAALHHDADALLPQ